jgi:hypothetical protein
MYEGRRWPTPTRACTAIRPRGSCNTLSSSSAIETQRRVSLLEQPVPPQRCRLLAGIELLLMFDHHNRPGQYIRRVRESCKRLSICRFHSVGRIHENEVGLDSILPPCLQSPHSILPKDLESSCYPQSIQILPNQLGRVRRRFHEVNHRRAPAQSFDPHCSCSRVEINPNRSFKSLRIACREYVEQRLP